MSPVGCTEIHVFALHWMRQKVVIDARLEAEPTEKITIEEFDYNGFYNFLLSDAEFSSFEKQYDFV